MFWAGQRSTSMAYCLTSNHGHAICYNTVHSASMYLCIMWITTDRDVHSDMWQHCSCSVHTTWITEMQELPLIRLASWRVEQNEYCTDSEEKHFPPSPPPPHLRHQSQHNLLSYIISQPTERKLKLTKGLSLTVRSLSYFHYLHKYSLYTVIAIQNSKSHYLYPLP